MNKKVNVIIAEDHILYRDLLIKELETYNVFCVAKASNGKELLAILKDNSNAVILLDIEMPEMNGKEALIQIKQTYPFVKILIVSQHNDMNLIEHFKDLGVQGYLPKDYISGNFQFLINAIHDLYNNKTYFVYYDKDKKYIKYTNRERELIPLICEGKTIKEIATSLSIGEKVVEKHRKNLFKKTESKNISTFIKFSIQRGLNFLGGR